MTTPTPAHADKDFIMIRRVVTLAGLLILVALFVFGPILAAASIRSTAAESRSPEWPRIRADHLRTEPECAACGKREFLNVHHIYPFHLFPDRELDQSNLITLCRDHHFSLGHAGVSWSAYNPDVRIDAQAYRSFLRHCAEARERLAAESARNTR
jgi:hypothetical protein